MKYLALIFLLFAAQAAAAQDWAKAKLEKSPRHREWVTIKHDGRSIETFVVYPESKAKTPVVLVIHEIFGMTDWVQDLADQLAEAGYIAVAPDLLSGMGPNGGRSSDFPQGKATEAVSHLNPDQVTADPGQQRQIVCHRILLGRRPEFPLRHESRRFSGRIRFLRAAAG